MTSEFGTELVGYPPNIVDVPGCHKIYTALKPARIYTGGIESLHSRVARTVVEDITTNTPLIQGLQESGLQIVYAYTSQGLNRFTGTDLGRLVTSSVNRMDVDGRMVKTFLCRINAMRVFIGKKREQEVLSCSQDLNAPILKLTNPFRHTIFMVGHHPQDIVEGVEKGIYEEDFRFVSLFKPA